MQLHVVETLVPHVKLTNNTDRSGVRRPYGKVCSLYAVDRHHMCTKLVKNTMMLALSEHIAVKVGDLLLKCVRIIYLNKIIIPVLYTETVLLQIVLFGRDGISEEIFYTIHAQHLADLVSLFVDQPYMPGTGTICGKYLSFFLLKLVTSQQILRSIYIALGKLSDQVIV